MPSVIVYVAVPFWERTSDPLPSAANIDAEGNERVTVPVFSARNVIEIKRPTLPEYALGDPPAKLTEPLEFEKLGSTGHREKIDPSFDTRSTARIVRSNEMVPSAALTPGAPPDATMTFTLNVAPVPNDPEAGEKDRSAVCACRIARMKTRKKNIRDARLIQ